MTVQDWYTVETWVEASQSTTVADALRIFGGRVLSPEEGREIMPEDTDWAAIQLERAYWQQVDGCWRRVALSSGVRSRQWTGRKR